MSDPCIAVVIPCYRVKEFVLRVISEIGPEVRFIYAVDDACPEQSGKFIQQNCSDPRVRVLFNPVNLGVGGATKHGMAEAIADGADIIVKVDGDGQMDPKEIPKLVSPIERGVADYAKGNRFFSWGHLRSMPNVRMFGNSVLSFMTKATTGYWHVMDPTNGFVAIHASVGAQLNPQAIDNGYFFETDLLFQLRFLGAVVIDVPTQATYGDEKSNLRILKVIGPFVRKHSKNLFRRFVYEYYIRDFSLASLQFFLGAIAFGTGMGLSLYHWLHGLSTGVPTEFGLIVLSVMPIFVGIEFLLAAINYDIQNRRTYPLHLLIESSAAYKNRNKVSKPALPEQLQVEMKKRGNSTR